MRLQSQRLNHARIHPEHVVNGVMTAREEKILAVRRYGRVPFLLFRVDRLTQTDRIGPTTIWIAKADEEIGQAVTACARRGEQ